MKTDFSINVQVNMGVTPEVVTLVTAILSHRPSQAPTAAVEAIPPQPQPKPEQAQVSEPEQERPTSGGVEKAEADAASEQPQPSAPVAATDTDKPKELTTADIREAIHRTRQRIEGEDYKDHTDGEAYKKYHRTLTSVFKQIAALLGSDLPSQLPADKRQSFIDQCEQLKVLDDGTVGTDLPF